MLQDHIPLCVLLVVRAGMYTLDIHVILYNHGYLRYINATRSHSFVPKHDVIEQR